jgi:hypothetical protein
MRTLSLAFLVLLSSFYVLIVPCLAIDKSLIGSWQTTTRNSHGASNIRWEIRFGGGFSWTTNGPQGSSTESGLLSADNGQWG